MKYRLKDRELQAKLDEISGGDFSELLGGVEDTGFSALRIPLCGFIEDAGQTIPRVEVYVRRQDVEEVPQYDQNKWNKWPDVKPPIKNKYYLVTRRIGGNTPRCPVGVFSAKFGSEGWIGVGNSRIVAWAELPKPYEPPPPLDMHPDAVYAREFMANEWKRRLSQL